MPSKLTRGFGVTPGQRFSTGLIVSVVLRETGERRSRHFTGDTASALSDMAEWCDSLNARVLAISTPQTVYRDLLGSRRSLVDRQVKNRVTDYSNRTSDSLDVPEALMLGRIKRGDLLDA